MFEDYALSVIENLPDEESRDMPDGEPRIFDELEERRQLLGEIGDFVSARPPREPIEIPLSGPESETISVGLELYGLEFLAFYKSPHYLRYGPFPGMWGIFMTDWGLEYVRRSIDERYPGQFKWLESFNRAFGFLRAHEVFHYRVDAWALSAEALLNRHLYRPYMRFVYRRYWPGDECLEESLANGSVLAPRRLPDIREFSREFIKSQPGAYGNPVQPGIVEREVLAAQLVQNFHWQPWNSVPALGQWVGYGRPTLLDERNCPVYFIVGTRPTQFVTPAFSPPDLREFKTFVTNYLAGAVERKTDHELYRIDNGELLKIPNPHGNVDRLKPHEFKGSLMKAGMTNGDYRRERSRTNVWKRRVPRGNPLPSVR